MLGEGGLYLATTDPEQIKRWWTKWPAALIGVPMGRRVGFWALDVDSKEGHCEDGLGAWNQLQLQHRDDTDGRVHKTGTDGLHFFYSWDNNRPVGCPTSSVPPGMEVKGEGGYVIFPPSPYLLDRRIVSYDVSLDKYPEAALVRLYDLIKAKPQRKANGNGAGNYAWPDGFGQKKLDECCETVRTATEHHWDEACRSVFMLGRWAGGNVERAFLNGILQPVSPFIEEQVHLNDFVAYLPQHLYIYISTREHGPRRVSMGGSPA
jgi:hypothetical protein